MTVPAAVVFPDAELVLRGWLVDRLPGVRVVTDLPGSLDGEVVQVTRIGGATEVVAVVDRPRFDLDVYAPSRGAASARCRQVAALLPTMRGQTVGGAVVTDYTEEVGPSWRPDLNDQIRRFGMTFVLSLRPA